MMRITKEVVTSPSLSFLQSLFLPTRSSFAQSSQSSRILLTDIKCHLLVCTCMHVKHMFTYWCTCMHVKHMFTYWCTYMHVKHMFTYWCTYMHVKHMFYTSCIYNYNTTHLSSNLVCLVNDNPIKTLYKCHPLVAIGCRGEADVEACQINICARFLAQEVR